MGKRNAAPPSTPLAIRQDYDRNVTRLLHMTAAQGQDGEPIPHTIPVSPEARQLLENANRELEPQLGEGGDLAQFSDWASKLTGAMARIAGLLHVARGGQWSAPIGAETVQSALAFGAYLISHAVAAFGVMGADDGVTAAADCWRWVVRGDRLTFTRRDLFNGLRARFKRADALDAPLSLLEMHGYIRRATSPARVGRPTEAWDVNPIALANPEGRPKAAPNFAYFAYFALDPREGGQGGGIPEREREKPFRVELNVYTQNTQNTQNPPGDPPPAPEAGRIALLDWAFAQLRPHRGRAELGEGSAYVVTIPDLPDRTLASREELIAYVTTLPRA